MSKQVDEIKEKMNEMRKHLPYWASEVLKMKEESQRKQDLKSSSLEAS